MPVSEQAVNELPEARERRRGDRRRANTRRFRQRRGSQIPVLFPLLLIAVLSLALLLVVYSWQSAKTINAEMKVFGSSLAVSLSAMSRDALEQLTDAPGQSQLTGLIAEHPNFRYLIVESRHGERLALISSGAGEARIPLLPLSPSQRASIGEREFRTDKRTTRLVEFYAPFAGDSQRIVRIGFLKPTFYWQPGGEYYFLLSLPLLLLSFAALSTLFSTYLPLEALRNHFKFSDGKDALSTIDNTQAKSPLIDDFNSLIANAKQIVHEIESKHDSLDLDRKVLHYDKLRTEAVLNTLTIGIAVLDASGTITYCNKRFGSFFPDSKEDGTGKDFLKWCPSDEVRSYYEAYRKNSDLATNELQYAYAHRQNHTKLASVIMQPLRTTGSQEALGNIIVFQDVTATLHNKKMSEEFAIKAAHELKTPLHVVKMYSEMLMEDDLDPALRVESLNTIYDEVDRMADLVNNLLNIAKIEMGSITVEKTRVKTPEFLSDVFDNMARAATNQALTLTKDIPEGLSTIVVDKDLIRIALNNLLSNAIKYNRKDGEVRLYAEENDDAIRIHVSDKGPGISQEDQQQIFEKFYRSEDANIRKKSGHGLGLTLARNIVQLHHGSLSVSSVPGEGSCFTIEFSKKSNITERGA